MALMYCLVTIESCELNRIMKDLSKLADFVREMNPVYGDYDLVLKVKGNDRSQLNNLASQIRRVNGVTSIKPLIVNDLTRASDDVMVDDKILFVK